MLMRLPAADALEHVFGEAGGKGLAGQHLKRSPGFSLTAGLQKEGRVEGVLIEVLGQVEEMCDDQRSNIRVDKRLQYLASDF